MKLWKKFTKHFGITSVVFGAGLLTLSSALVGVGTTSSAYLTNNLGEYSLKVKIGVGEQSYGDVSYYVVNNGSGKVVDTPEAIKPIADDIVQQFKTIEQGKSLSQATEYLKNTRKGILESSEYTTAKNAITTAKAKVDAVDPTSSTYLDDLAAAKGELFKAEKAIEPIESQINDIDNIISVKNSANSMMLSGAILLPIFAILLGLGIGITVIRVKEEKTTKTE